jgi:hypothetical protein
MGRNGMWRDIREFEKKNGQRIPYFLWACSMVMISVTETVLS